MTAVMVCTRRLPRVRAGRTRDLRLWCVHPACEIVCSVRPSPTSAIRSLDWDEPVFVDGEDSIRTVASILHRTGVGAAVVARRVGDAGMVSERDIVAAIAGGADLERSCADDLATRGLITAEPHDSVIDVSRRLIDSGVRHLAIVDRDEVVGVLSIRDLFEVFVDSFGDGTEASWT